MFWIWVNILRNRYARTNREKVEVHVMTDVMSVHRDARTMQGSEKNVGVCGVAVTDGADPSREVQGYGAMQMDDC